MESVHDYPTCVESVESLRVSQPRGLLVISRNVAGGPKSRLGDTPELPSTAADELQADELQADAVRQVKAA